MAREDATGVKSRPTSLKGVIDGLPELRARIAACIREAVKSANNVKAALHQVSACLVGEKFADVQQSHDTRLSCTQIF